MFQLVVEELWLRAFIAEVVVVVGGYQPYPIAHSTHVVHSSPHAPFSVHSLYHDFGLLASHAGALGVFGSHTGFLPLPTSC